MQNITDMLKGWLSYIDNNENVTTGIAIILIIYSAFIVQRLSPFVLKTFDNLWVKLLLLFIIAYSAKQSPTVALLGAIAFMVTLQMVATHKVEGRMGKVLQETEGMDNVDMYFTQSNGEMIQEDAISGIEHETKSRPAKMVDEDQNCVLNKKYRNDFYPQYENLDTDTYKARFNTGVSGVDDTCHNDYVASNAATFTANDRACGYAPV